MWFNILKFSMLLWVRTPFFILLLEVCLIFVFDAKITAERGQRNDAEQSNDPSRAYKALPSEAEVTY